MSEELRSDTVYLMYIQYDLTKANADEIAEQMNRSMGLALYNSGDRQNGIKVFGKELDVSLGDWMEQKYTDNESIIKLNSLSDAKCNMACEYLVTVLKNKTVFKADELEALIIEAVNSTDKKETSGGGGGSKGSSGKKVSSFEVPKTPAKTSVFKDMEQTAWAKEAVESLYKNGILSGDGNGNFLPDSNVSREEFVKIAVLLCGLEPI